MRVVWFYIYSAFSNLKGSRLVVNLAGLAIGVALSVFVLFFARYEMSWDKHFANYKQIYRFASVVSIGNMQSLTAVTPMPLYDLLKSQPEVESAVRLYNGGHGIVDAQNQRFHESRFFYADKSFFDVFDLPFISGSGHSALDQREDVVITQSTAKKYFGHANPLGKYLKYNDSTYIVSAVVADLPANTHFHFDFLAANDMTPFVGQDSMMEKSNNSWLHLSVYTYAKLRLGTNPDLFAQQINEIKDHLASPQVQQVRELYNSPDEPVVIDFAPEPITHIHYISKAEMSIEPSINYSYLIIFIVLATLVLFFTGLNFAYITATSSLSRHFDFRNRMMMGATRFQLFGQLMVEMLVYSSLAVVVALAIVEVLLPLINMLFQLRLGLWTSGLHAIDVLLYVFLVFVVSGLVPALRFAYRRQDTDIMHYQVAIRRFSWRGIILFFQIFLFVFLLFVFCGIWYQLHSLEMKNPGFDPQRVMVIERGDLLDNHWADFKRDIENAGFDFRVAFAQSIPGLQHATRSYRLSGSNTDPLAMLATNTVSPDYFEVMGHSLKNGAFIGGHSSDSLAVMLNECAVQEYGLIKPIGERIEMDFDNSNESKDLIVKGVVGDYHFEPYTQPIKPMVIFLSSHQKGMRYILIRASSEFDSKAVSSIEKVWKRYLPEVPVQMKSLSAYVDKQFDDDYRMLRIGFVLLLIAAYVMLTGVFVYTDSIYERRRHIVSVKLLCGASSIRMALEQSHRIFLILMLAVGMAFSVFWVLFRIYQSGFIAEVDFPWLLILSGSVASLLGSGILFILFYYFFSIDRPFLNRLMKG